MQYTADIMQENEYYDIDSCCCDKQMILSNIQLILCHYRTDIM